MSPGSMWGSGNGPCSAGKSLTLSPSFNCYSQLVQAPENEKMPPATKASVHKSLLSFTKYFFPAVDKVHSSDTPNEAALLARQVCEAAPKTSRDDGRAYLVAEGSEGLVYAPTGEVDGQEVGRLEVTGTIRGGTLSADRLVHIPGRGDFQVEEVSSVRVLVSCIAHKADL